MQQSLQEENGGKKLPAISVHSRGRIAPMHTDNIVVLQRAGLAAVLDVHDHSTEEIVTKHRVDVIDIGTPVSVGFEDDCMALMSAAEGRVVKTNELG
ncbi:MAG: hypothetical protein CSA68_03310 [Rhodobacterales bacterium]|nr:MAG: hypothetical protein CSA68_03310 [Rhodobacterales bacterium]